MFSKSTLNKKLLSLKICRNPSYCKVSSYELNCLFWQSEGPLLCDCRCKSDFEGSWHWGWNEHREISFSHGTRWPLPCFDLRSGRDFSAQSSYLPRRSTLYTAWEKSWPAYWCKSSVQYLSSGCKIESLLCFSCDIFQVFCSTFGRDTDYGLY